MLSTRTIPGWKLMREDFRYCVYTYTQYVYICTFCVHICTQTHRDIVVWLMPTNKPCTRGTSARKQIIFSQGIWDTAPRTFGSMCKIFMNKYDPFSTRRDDGLRAWKGRNVMFTHATLVQYEWLLRAPNAWPISTRSYYVIYCVMQMNAIHD